MAVQRRFVGRRAWFRIEYSRVFRTHLERAAEPTLTDAYELGREAVSLGLSLLDIAEIHHQALVDAAAEAPLDARQLLLASELFAELLSAFEMIRRGYRDVHRQVTQERRRSMMLRRLSNVLADESLATSPESLSEALQLVAEHARELTGAVRCVVRTAVDGAGVALESAASEGPDVEQAQEDGSPHLVVVRSLAGTEVGSIALTAAANAELSADDLEVVTHLAELAGAALERAHLHRFS